MLEAMTELQREKDRLQQLMEHEELLQEELRSREAKMYALCLSARQCSPSYHVGCGITTNVTCCRRDAQEQVDTAPTPAVEEVSESEYDTSIEGADGQLSREAFRACLAGEAATLQELFDQGADLSLMKTIPDGKVASPRHPVPALRSKWGVLKPSPRDRRLGTSLPSAAISTYCDCSGAAASRWKSKRPRACFQPTTRSSPTTSARPTRCRCTWCDRRMV